MHSQDIMHSQDVLFLDSSIHFSTLVSRRRVSLTLGFSLASGDNNHVQRLSSICHRLCMFLELPKSSAWDSFVGKFSPSVNNSFYFYLVIILFWQKKNTMDILSNDLEESRNTMATSFSSLPPVNDSNRKCILSEILQDLCPWSFLIGTTLNHLRDLLENLSQKQGFTGFLCLFLKKVCFM